MNGINETRIVIYDLTGDKQVLKSYNNKDEFDQDKDNLFKDATLLNQDGKEIHIMDDVIKCLENNKTYIGTTNDYENSNYGNCWTKTINYKMFHLPEQNKQEEKSSQKNNNNKNIEQNNPKNNFFYIKCDDRCYLKFKLPLIFDVKSKILYNPYKNQNITAGFSIPEKNKFCLSVYQGYPPMPDNSLYTFGCDYRWGDQVNRMCYVNHNTYNFEKYQYLVNCDGCKDFQPLPLDYFDNIYDGFKNKGISTLPKTLFGCSSYDNVKGNVCCLGLRCDAPMPKPFTMSWENISARFNLNGINGEQKALNSQNK